MANNRWESPQGIGGIAGIDVVGAGFTNQTVEVTRDLDKPAPAYVTDATGYDISPDQLPITNYQLPIGIICLLSVVGKNDGRLAGN